VTGARTGRPALSVLDLVPVPTGCTVRQALADSLDLVVSAESLGYAGYWFGEHHFTPGRAGSVPALLVAIAAERTSRIRIGSAANVLHASHPLALVEQFGTLAEVHPGRVVLGLGRGAGVREIPQSAASAAALARFADFDYRTAGIPVEPDAAVYPDLVPTLTQVGSEDEETRLGMLLSLLHRPVTERYGHLIAATPGYGTGLVPWIFGNTPGTSARMAARYGLPFVVNAHIASNPGPAAAAYREQFVPSPALPEPYVGISAHVLVAERREEADWLATAYPPTVRDMFGRGMIGTVPAPGAVVEVPPDAPWAAAYEAGLAARHIGQPAAVAASLAELAASAEADEVLVGTVTHRPADRLRSYELLIDAWREL